AEERGSTATICSAGLRSRRYSPTPVMVPPVPTPATSASTRPSSARSISGPEVRRCASGLAGLENWSGRKTSASRAIARAASTASGIEGLELCEQLHAAVRRGRALEHLREPNQRRVADELRNVDRDSAHAGPDNSGAAAGGGCG